MNGRGSELPKGPKWSEVAGGEQDSMSVSRFCRRNDISKAFFYVLLKEGKGPTTMMVRGRRLVSREAAAKWRRQMETTSQRSHGEECT